MRRGVKAPSRYFMRDNQGLDLDEMRAKLPAIFATEAHSSRSNKYVQVPTSDVLMGLISEGFVPVQAMQAAPKLEGKVNFAKHLVRMRRRDELGVEKANMREIILLNSSDGTSSYQLMNGIFRLVCSNGLICCDVDQDYRVRHGRDAVNSVIEVAYKILEDDARIYNNVNEMQAITVNQEEKNLLAEFAYRARFNLSDDEPLEDRPIKPSQLLVPKRVADNKSDLWTTMNIIQEHAIRGGLSGRAPRQPGEWRGRRTTTKEVNGIDQNVSFNKLLWSFTEKLAQIHGLAVK